MTAVQFLTIIPVGKRLEVPEPEMAGSVTAFPFVGLMQGMLLVCSAYLFAALFPDNITCVLVLLVLVVLNGGLHLDGLSDTFDALAKRGDRESKLKVMKDSNAGAIGVTAIVFSLLIKYLSLNALSVVFPGIFVFSLLLMPVLSKWTMIMAMLHGRPARPDGIGRIFIQGIGLRPALTATLTVFLITGLGAMGAMGAMGSMTLFLSGVAPTLPIRTGAGSLTPLLFCVAAMVLLYLFSRLCVRFFKRQFGGLTGDTLGAVSELTEIIFLLMVLGWSRLYI